MKIDKRNLLSPLELHYLSYYSEIAADSAHLSIYDTAQWSQEEKNEELRSGSNCVFIEDNGIVNFDGKSAPYSRKKFVDNPYYACVGCSYTVSKGLPVEYSWPSIVETFTGKTVNNYSELGASYRKIAALTIDASVTYGAPKHVLALMPDPYRMWFPYSWTRNEECSQIIFGHGYWDKEVKSYLSNYMGSGNSPLFSVDHCGKKHAVAPEVAAFSNMAILDSMKSIFESMSIPFDCMTWYNSENPSNADAHDVFTIKRNPNINLKTSTSYSEEFTENERKIGGDGRWRRHGAPSRVDTCDHVPLTQNQENFWYVASNSNHPGLHDQIHYAEQMLGLEIPCSFMKEIP